jgi:hypothetical protein
MAAPGPRQPSLPVPTLETRIAANFPSAIGLPDGKVGFEEKTSVSSTWVGSWFLVAFGDALSKLVGCSPQSASELRQLGSAEQQDDCHHGNHNQTVWPKNVCEHEIPPTQRGASGGCFDQTRIRSRPSRSWDAEMRVTPSGSDLNLTDTRTARERTAAGR